MPICNASARISTAKRLPPSRALLPRAPLPSSALLDSSPLLLILLILSPAKIPANKSKANQGRFKNISYLCSHKALVAKLVDAPDLGSGVARRVGSSPIRRTTDTAIPDCNRMIAARDCRLLWASSKRQKWSNVKVPHLASKVRYIAFQRNLQIKIHLSSYSKW